MGFETIFRLAHDYEFAAGFFERQRTRQALRDAIHASPGYKRQIEALRDLTKAMSDKAAKGESRE